MGVLRRVQGEHALQVLGEIFALFVGLNSLDDGSIDFLLVLLAGFVGNEPFFLGSKDITFARFLFLLDLQTTEVGIIQVFGYFVIAQVDAGGSANDKALRNATQWAGVQAEGTSDQQKARGEGLQQNNTFTLVATGQQNEYGTGFKVGANVTLVLAEASLGWTLAYEFLGGVVGLWFLLVNGTFTTVLGTTDLLDYLEGGLDSLDNWTLGTLQTPLSTAFVHLALGVTQDTAIEVSI
uniref:Uncharacterized protein n=1 Tax=Haematobia irritans TaxID=7368 RepID=A0A1L8E6I7_HAEIR